MTAKRAGGGGSPAGAPSGLEGHPSPGPSAQNDWWKRNILGLLAIAPVVLAATRIVMFSRGDPVLLSAFAQSLDVPTVLLGGVVPFLGIVWSYGLFVVVANRHITPTFGRWLRELRPLPMTLFMLFQGVVILTTPVHDALMFLVLPAVGLMYCWVTAQMDKRGDKYFPADVPAIVAASVLVGLITWPPWLPTEALTFSDGTRQTAYVMATEDGWTTLVDAESRAVSRVAEGEIVARDVCGADRGRTLLNVVWGGSPQPPCPDTGGRPSAPQVTPTPVVSTAPSAPAPTSTGP